MHNKQDIIVQQLLEADIPRLEEFYKRVWPNTYTHKYPNRLNWIIKENPFIPKDFGLPIWIAEIDRKIVGHTSAMIVPYLIEGAEVICSYSVDTIVDINYRGLGIGQKLQLLNRNSNKLFVSIGIAPTNQHIKAKQGNKYGKNVYSLHYIYKLDKRAIIRAFNAKLNQVSDILNKIINCIKLPQITASILNLRLKSSVKRKLNNLDNLVFEEVTTFDNRFDQVWQTCRKNYELCAERTSTYLEWKYSKVPDLNYKKYIICNKQSDPVGVLVFRKGSEAENNMILIAELYFTHFVTEWYEETSYFLTELFKSSNVTSINITTTDLHIKKLFENIGFKHIETIQPMYYYANETSKSYDDMVTLITRGESDLDQFGLLHQPFLNELITKAFHA